MARAIELWRRLPEPMRFRAHRGAQAISRATVPLWVSLARRGPADPGHDVAVLGLFRSSIGIGQGARLFADALERQGFVAHRLDAGDWAQVRPDLPSPAPEDASAAGVVISHLNPPELERVLESSRARFLKGRRHIGYWAWELPIAPQRWRRAFRYVDEVWAPSTFTADALRRIAPASLIVRVVPHPVWAWSAPCADRPGLGLPEHACLVLVALDLKSTAARKNPRGALEAFRRAVGHGGPDAALVCKISGAQAEPALFAALQAECAQREDVILVDGVLSQERMAALVASVDIVFSPHRAEGFGLLLAEGMRLGKAVVATGWSGNMDYMDDDCAALIRYTLAPADDPQGMYGQGVWAEPDLDHAAGLLAALIADSERRRALGERAAARFAWRFDPSAWGTVVSRHLRNPPGRGTLPPPGREDRPT